MTNIQLITQSLRAIGVISEIETPSAEQGSDALKILNQMLETWTESEIRLGYFEQTSTTATLPLPKWAEAGVRDVLAITLAPNYGATVSQELAASANDTYGTIVRKCMNDRMRPADMSHLPGQMARFDIVNG